MKHDEPYPPGYVTGILDSVRTIAVVGISPKPSRPSHVVMSFLIGAGYEVFAINPRAGTEKLFGRQVYGSLSEIGHPVDMVDVFRKSIKLKGVAQEAIEAGAKVLWAQLGVYDAAAAGLAENAGLQVVMNRCPKIELKRLGR